MQRIRALYFLWIALCSGIFLGERSFGQLSLREFEAYRQQAEEWIRIQKEAAKEFEEFSSQREQSLFLQNQLHNQAKVLSEKMAQEALKLHEKIPLKEEKDFDVFFQRLVQLLEQETAVVSCGEAPSLIEIGARILANAVVNKEGVKSVFKLCEGADLLGQKQATRLKDLSKVLDQNPSKPTMRDSFERMLLEAKLCAYEQVFAVSFEGLGQALEVQEALKEQGLSHRLWRIREGSIQALAQQKGELWVEDFLKALGKEKEERVLGVLWYALGRAGVLNPAVKNELKKATKSKSDLVLMAALEAVVALKAYSLIPEWIALLKKDQGVLNEKIETALRQMTGETHYQNAKVWEVRWKKTLSTQFQDGQALPTSSSVSSPSKNEEEKAGVTVFYGIPTSSQKIFFILDISGSMRQPASEDEKRIEGSAVVEKGAKVEGVSKLEVAKKHLIQTIENLPAVTHFNIVAYSTTYFRWNTTLQQATPAMKKSAIGFIEGLEGKGDTNIFDPLADALHRAGRGVSDRAYELTADTIFLLSDGAPNRGRISTTTGILKEVAQLNPWRRVTIHTVGIGPDHDSSFMEKLALENGGSYRKRGVLR